MSSDRKVRVAIVGLGFGAEFIPIYQAHPNAEMYAVCRRDKAELDRAAKQFGIPRRTPTTTNSSKTPTSTRSTSTARFPITQRRPSRH